ncbi:hypothetical protein [Sphingomonas sp. BAUL-RG-20F-R05-02]|uniref:hypothetical protein n=1 Tax=Sphingomonas sp. BAUL-RG-20F-R05-02 TaxID=2914830 RepID=UPI001F55B858|nr:hypothetical protein [Sphingomonas sp. BAUL-RG-20F-R05-02]
MVPQETEWSIMVSWFGYRNLDFSARLIAHSEHPRIVGAMARSCTSLDLYA